MRRRGMREGGIASYQRAVWTFLRWLHGNGYVPVDFSAIVPRIHADDSQVHRPTAQRADIDRMLKVAGAEAEHGKRNKALVAVFASTGIRRSELAMVDFEDLDLEAGTIHVRHGKGGTQRLIGVGAEARACLWDYIINKRGQQPGPLFLARGGVRMSAGAMADVLEDLRRLSSTDITSHQFRRHAADRLLSQGAPVDVVMGQLGHSTPGMSLMYGHRARSRRTTEMFHALEQGIRRLV